MATFIKIKYAKQKDHLPSVMRSVLSYCLQPEKTRTEENVWTVSGQNCTPQFAFREFMANKALWHKEKGLCFRHYVQSFPKDEDITPEEANRIGMELAERVWSGYGVIVATHIDREHIHNHFVIDTVHTETGRKLHEDIDNMERLRKVNDEICMAHGLSVLSPYGKGKTKSISAREYRSGSKGKSWKFRLRAAIKYCMEHCANREEFIALMKRCGYGVYWEDDRKHITYTCYKAGKYPNGDYRKCRDNKLSDEKYLKENMEYEFTIRQEILAGRNDGDAQGRAFGRDADSGDNRRRMDGTAEYNQRDAEFGERDNRQPQGDASRESRVFSGNAKDGEQPPNDTGKGSQADDTHGEGHNRADGTATRSTGWEAERNAFFYDRASGKTRAHTLGRSSSVQRAPRRAGIAVGSLVGLASVMDGEDENKTPEEIEAEERARLAGENVAAVLELIRLGVELSSDGGTDEDFTMKM